MRRSICRWLISVLLLWAGGLGAEGMPDLRARIEAEGALSGAAGFERIWRALQGVSTLELIELSQAQDNNYFEQGWFELARRYRLAPPGERAAQLDAWKRDWYHHPASNWLSLLQGPSVARMALPDVIRSMGVLLPLEGTFASEGQAVLAGIRAALEWDRQRGMAIPDLTVKDTSGIRDPSSLIGRLSQQEGVDLVVGPLQPGLSTRLNQALPVAVLALNRTGERAFNGFQLDLASDQELVQLAELMSREGRQRILLLAPSGEGWVEPLLVWAEQQLKENGMVPLGRLRFESELKALERQLSRWLGLDASRARGMLLQQITGTEAQLTPRRRQDVDAVLLIARPEQARLVKPVLDYLHAGNLPVYASAHLFSGTPDPNRDRDLEGIRFCDMPWRLRQREGVTSSSVFFALGVDAGSVYRALGKMQAGVPGYFEGETGRLRLNESGRLTRTLLCARFRHGVPEPYVWGSGRPLQ
ncbi:penicillin-binding protein activator [Marinobacterium sp. AK62]|uniref:Penicillin-binding protein activator n=1 Tax=Marinobacterium alkalitolerans TaxID=1542925 RepID=A0ABS3Z9X4_9GAMM|nr:penicillin-binding protein activator [Marinobacterium alkalitolerans]MBP0048135.1 penicillin-binding protein activator [Marinobacterium alkalitolerans]